MPASLETLRHADTNHAVEIADRIWWVGHVIPKDNFQCHVYLLEQGEQSVLFDPGSRLTFAHTLRKIEEVAPLSAVRYYVCHHQDPDIAAALPLIDELNTRSDAAVVTHWRTQALLKHYGVRLPFWLIDEHDWKLELEDRTLEFVFTPYAHFPGAFCSFERSTGVLFSSDLFGGFTEEPQLVALDESHFDAVRPLHEHYMPSSEILDYALSQVERYPVEMIAAQHGSIIPQHLVGFIICRNIDVPVRFGGEEFLVLVIGQQLSGAIALAKRLRAKIAQHRFDIGTDEPLMVTASLGVAQRDAQELLDGLIHRADMALYEAKRAGRNRYVVAEPDQKESASTA